MAALVMWVAPFKVSILAHLPETVDGLCASAYLESLAKPGTLNPVQRQMAVKPSPR